MGKYENLVTFIGFEPGAHRWRLTVLTTELTTELVELLLDAVLVIANYLCLDILGDTY